MTATQVPVPVATGHSELIRVLGAIALTPPPGSDSLCRAAGLPQLSSVEHTDTFVLLAPPYAAIHLGPEGKLGGEGLDRVEGFWRALGQQPPEDADHLGVLLMAYSGLLDRAAAAPAAAKAAETLFAEHIWPFAPGYLRSVRTLGDGASTAWAQLTLDVLAEQRDAWPEPAMLPLALRDAPPPIDDWCEREELLDAAVTPARSGVLLTQRELAAGAARLGVGFRRGERRYALRAMLEQDTAATLNWLADLGQEWSRHHLETYGDEPCGRWWSTRAQRSAAVLQSMATRAGR